MGSSKALLFHNPLAGRVPLNQNVIDSVVNRLRQIGYETSVQEVNGNDYACQPESLKTYDLLIISGGDGTWHDMLPRVVEASIPMAILPTGTANVFARELGIPKRLEDAVGVVQSGQKKRLRLGSADGRLFHLMAGIGIDGYIISKVSPASKKLLGVIAFWLAGLSRFWSYPLKRFEVEIEDETFDATFAVISNCRLYGGNLQITPQASVFDDTLDVCLFRSRSHCRSTYSLFGCPV